MEAYFDNSATTVCYDEVADAVFKLMTKEYGNPSAMHNKGVEAEEYVRKAAKSIAKTLKVTEKEILFTSGGTESDNLAVIGGTLANRRAGNHIITTAIEHAAVAEPFAFLKKQGFEVTILPVDETGTVSLKALKEALREDTILVSVMHVNNETGALQPIEEIGRIIHEHNKEIIFHVDAIQGYGKYEIRPKKAGIDLLSVSAHKIHGPKGVGFLYIRNGVKIQPLILGGGQQNGMRSGTDNVPGIVGMSLAAEIMYKNLAANTEHLYRLKRHMADRLQEIENVIINGQKPEEGAPHIMSLSFMGIRSEVLLHALEDREIFISAGSACSSHKRKPSATLSAMGIPTAQIENTVRVSFSELNTIEEIDYVIETLKELVPMLRKYSRH